MWKGLPVRAGNCGSGNAPLRGLQLGQSYRMRGFGQGGRAQPGSVADSGHGALHKHFALDPPAAGVVLVGFSIAG